MQSEPSSGIKWTACSGICWLFIEYYDARKHKDKITFINDQIDAKFFYFAIRLLQSSTCFEQRRAHHQEVKLY